MNRCRLGLACLVPLALAACTAPATNIHERFGPGATSLASPSPTTATPSLSAVPAAAVVVATRYATASFSYDYRLGPDAWIDAVAGLCTAQWFAQLRSSADGASGGWSQAVADQAIATATVMQVLPARPVPPALRLEVVLRVSVEGVDPESQYRAVMVDVLVSGSDSWHVSWAG